MAHHRRRPTRGAPAFPESRHIDTTFSGSDFHDLLDVVNEDLAVSGSARPRRPGNQINYRLGCIVVEDDLDF